VVLLLRFLWSGKRTEDEHIKQTNKQGQQNKETNKHTNKQRNTQRPNKHKQILNKQSCVRTQTNSKPSNDFPAIVQVYTSPTI